MSNNKALACAISAVIALGINNTSVAAESTMEMSTNIKGMEKCYGIAKAGMNDCGTANHNCSGEAKIDRDPKNWIFTPTGLCKRIAGGSTKPPTSK
jgi:uncharacterized membrane protein